MAIFDTKIVAAIQRTNLAHELFEAALKEFNAFCAAQEWQKAEEARLKVVANMEAFLDASAEMHRVMRGL